MDEENKQDVPAEEHIPDPLPDVAEEVLPDAHEPHEHTPVVPTPAYIPKSTAAEDQKQTTWQKFKQFAIECKRVITVTKKPSRDEFKTIVKISGIGMAVIGFLGFLVTVLKELFL